MRKGSIAVNGVSLTVAGVDERHFDVQIIPYTWTHTNLHAVRAGEPVNLECDILGKYVARVDRSSPAPARSARIAVNAHDTTTNPAEIRRSLPSTKPIAAIRNGEMIIVVDDEDRENEGDLTIAAREDHARRRSTSWRRTGAA